MTLFRISAGLAASVMLVASPVAAQRMTLDLRSIGGSATEKLAGADLGSSLGIGATVAYRVQPHLHIYAGWDWVHFGAEQSFAGTDRDFEETGYTFGLRFEHPLTATGGIEYRVDAGGTYKHVEIENQDGDILFDSGHSLGFEFGAGLAFAIGDAWKFVPMARFRSLSPEFDMNNSVMKGDLRYVGLEAGFSLRFR
jgi:hypothetical protein